MIEIDEIRNVFRGKARKAKGFLWYWVSGFRPWIF